MSWLARRITPLPLTAKLKLANLVTSGAVIVLAGILLLALQGWLSVRSLLDRTRTDAIMTSANVSVATVFRDSRSAHDILAFLRASRDIKRAAVYDSNGKLFAVYQRDPDQPEPVEQVVADVAHYALNWLELSWLQPFDYQGERLGTMVVTGDLRTVYANLLSYIGMLLLLLGASLALASLALNRMQRQITRPLRQLSRVAIHVSEQGDFSVRAPVPGSSDVSQLAQTFNNILERIQRREIELTAEIVERQRMQEQLDFLAWYDNVTGLHNRHFFNQRLEQAVSYACQHQSRMALIFIDLDNFKNFNDTLGHATGDEVLRIVAQRVSHTVRREDVLARVGGDEFAIIVQAIPDVGVAEQVARKFLDALADPVFINGHEVFIGASIGISVCPDDATDVQDLHKYADSAMYFAKNGGKNAYCVFAPSMRGDAERRIIMEAAMRRALERDELQLLFQPKVDLWSARVVGAEALVRWHSPELGLLGPHAFIPLAEETGMIISIGEWVLRSACRQLKAWQDAGHGTLTMAVNLSGRQLRELSFVDKMRQVLQETGVDPTGLELELTESMLMDAGKQTIDKLRALKATGTRLAIDDFGTGYSSMSYLKMFPIDTLKIDQSFVRDLPGNSEDCAIVQAIIAMAHNLQLQVVAEGIETRGQGDFLRAYGCNLGQGMLYGEPMSVQELELRLQNNGGAVREKMVAGMLHPRLPH